MWIEWLIARMGWTSYETESRAMAMGYLRATAESGNGIWRLRLRVAVALRATMRRRASEWDEVLFLWARERDQSTARELRAMLGV